MSTFSASCFALVADPRASLASGGGALAWAAFGVFAAAALGGSLAALAARDARGGARAALVAGFGVAGLLALLGEDEAALLLCAACPGLALALSLLSAPRGTGAARILSVAAGLLAAGLAAFVAVAATREWTAARDAAVGGALESAATAPAAAVPSEAPALLAALALVVLAVLLARAGRDQRPRAPGGAP